MPLHTPSRITASAVGYNYSWCTALRQTRVLLLRGVCERLDRVGGYRHTRRSGLPIGRKDHIPHFKRHGRSVRVHDNERYACPIGRHEGVDDQRQCRAAPAPRVHVRSDGFVLRGGGGDARAAHGADSLGAGAGVPREVADGPAASQKLKLWEHRHSMRRSVNRDNWPGRGCKVKGLAVTTGWRRRGKVCGEQ